MLSDEEVGHREEAIKQALASDALEGGNSAEDAEYVSWLHAWAVGEVSEEDLFAHLADRYDHTRQTS